MASLTKTRTATSLFIYITTFSPFFFSFSFSLHTCFIGEFHSFVLIITSRSTPHELFCDFLEDLEERIDKDKRILRDILKVCSCVIFAHQTRNASHATHHTHHTTRNAQSTAYSPLFLLLFFSFLFFLLLQDVNFTVGINTPFEEFQTALSSHERFSTIPRQHLKHLFHEVPLLLPLSPPFPSIPSISLLTFIQLVDKAQSKEHSNQKRKKKLISSFKEMLKNFKELTVTSTWVEVISLPLSLSPSLIFYSPTLLHSCSPTLPPYLLSLLPVYLCCYCRHVRWC